MSSSNLKISIAVPSYNYSEYTRRCLESIRSQSYKNFEVLIADGGSDDGSMDIIREFCDLDTRFTLISTEDKGQADGIQKAFNIASGDIYCFLNTDDCYISIEALQSVIEAFIEYDNVDLVSMGGYYIDSRDKFIKKIQYRYHPLDNFSNMKQRTAVLQPGTFWRKKVFAEVGWFVDFKYIFDVVFFYYAYLKYRWIELQKPIVGYRLHGLNKSMSVRVDRITELAHFEDLKYGKYSLRGKYLIGVATLVKLLSHCGAIGDALIRLVYLAVNSLGFISAYRLPTI